MSVGAKGIRENLERIRERVERAAGRAGRRAEEILALPRLELCGLMCIPPLLGDAGRTRPYFAKLREARSSLAKRVGRALPVLSMGMSQDFEVAIEEGATEIRVGTALFGNRTTNLA